MRIESISLSYEGIVEGNFDGHGCMHQTEGKRSETWASSAACRYTLYAIYSIYSIIQSFGFSWLSAEGM